MVEFRIFDGDLQEVSNLIKASWAEDYQGAYKQPVMDYSSIEFLESNLRKPNSDPDLLGGAYSGGKLVGFLGGFSLNFRYNDMMLRGVSGSFCTTHIDYKRQGIAKTLIREATLKGIEDGYDIYCSVPDEGHPIERALENVSKETNIGYFKLHRFTFLAKPLDKNMLLELSNLPLYQKIALPFITKRAGTAIRKAYGFEPTNDIKTICQMLNSSYETNTLAVNWKEDMNADQFRDQISNTFYFNQEGRKGFINYYNIDLIGCRPPIKKHKTTMIDNVYFKNMSFFEKHHFVSDFCTHQKKHGSCLINIPTIPVFDLRPFYSNLFFPTGRYHCYFIQDLQHKLEEDVKAGYLFVR